MRKTLYVITALAVSAGLLLGVSLVFLKTRAGGFSALADPTAAEIFAARMVRSMALPSDARSRRNSVARTPEALEEGMAHWADHCAVCHGNDGAGDVAMGKHMYPHAPDMRKPETQKLTDGELFYTIENGVRLTGMPAWGGGSEAGRQASWQLVHFIRHLPDLTVAEIARMEKLNPKTQDDMEQERAEEQFLNGQTPAEAPKQHHH